MGLQRKPGVLQCSRIGGWGSRGRRGKKWRRLRAREGKDRVSKGGMGNVGLLVDNKAGIVRCSCAGWLKVLGNLGKREFRGKGMVAHGFLVLFSKRGKCQENLYWILKWGGRGGGVEGEVKSGSGPEFDV